jgi:hypothetical protein
VYFGAKNASGIKLFPSKKTEVIPPGVQIDVRVAVGSKKFSSLSLRIERSSGAYLPHRQYENMCLSNFPILIFRYPASFNPLEFCPKTGKAR